MGTAAQLSKALREKDFAQPGSASLKTSPRCPSSKPRVAQSDISLDMGGGETKWDE